MATQSIFDDKPSFWQRVNQLWGPVVLMSACFTAGYWWKSELDSAKIEMLQAEIDNGVSETAYLEDVFARYDIAQMSPLGEYQLLVGDGMISTGSSLIASDLRKALSAIQVEDYVNAIALLKKASSQMSNFPFTYYYLGVAEQSNQPSRSAPHFARAHELFSQLLRIKPNNSAMRLYDAMTLSYLGYGDSATIQLYRAVENDPNWRGLGCSNAQLKYDSTALSVEEKISWRDFVNAARSIRYDTTRLSYGSSAVDPVPPLPKISWPVGYNRIDK